MSIIDFRYCSVFLLLHVCVLKYIESTMSCFSCICVLVKLFMCPKPRTSTLLCTVKPLNSGHIGGRTLVRCGLSRRMTSWPHPSTLSSLNVFFLTQRVVTYKNPNQQISIRHAPNGQNGWIADYLNKKCPKLKLILMIYARGFGLCPLSEVILYRLVSFGGHAGCPLLCVCFSEVPNILFL